MGTIASIQGGIDYRRAAERDGCHNCKHVKRLPLLPNHHYPRLECARYGFFVKVADTCMHYAPAPAATALPTIEGGGA